MLTSYLFNQDNTKKLTFFSIISALLAVAIIAIFRKPDAIFIPQFWAEDGLFFSQARSLGWMSFLVPYASYYLFSQRFVALLANQFSVFWTPHIYTYSTLFILLGTVLFCLCSRLKTHWKIPFVFAIPLVPTGGEIWFNLTNIQWFTAILILIIAIQYPPKNYLQALFDIIALIVAGLTGPYIVFFLPLFIVRFISKSDPLYYRIILNLLVIALVGVQLQAIIHYNSTPSPVKFSQSIYDRVSIIGYIFPGGLFFGQFNDYLSTRLFYFITPFVFGIGVTLFYFLEKEDKWTVFSLILGAITVFGAALLKTLALISPYGAGGRYYYLPYLCIIWCIIICCNHSILWCRRIAQVGVFFILLSTATGFMTPRLPDCHWHHYAKIIKSGKAVVVPINPGWSLNVPAQAQ